MHRSTVYLAALLHDIGKFWQRADAPFAESKNLSPVSRTLAGYMCPPNELGGFGYQHVIWTHQFFEKFQGMFDQVIDYTTKQAAFRVRPYNEQHIEDNLVNLSVYHHRPNTILQAIVQMADWWSSGIDRIDENMEIESSSVNEPLQYGKSRFKKVPLHSLFTEIRVNDQYFTQKYGYDLTPLDTSNPSCFFPKQLEQANITDLTEAYHKLWAAFTSELDKMPKDSVEGFVETLTFLLRKYTWCIPSSTKDMANVSLYEHLKSTAALADCIHESYRERPESFTFDPHKKRLSVAMGHYPVLMLCCDLSGIQNFLYNVASAKAAKSLKGRSFYLQLVIESVIQSIILETGTTTGHVIYSSGGKFYMLLPNTAEVVGKLKKLREQFVEKIWKEQKMKLYLCMDWIPFCYRTGGNYTESYIESPELPSTPKCKLSDLWKAVSDKAAAQKTRKYRHLFSGEGFEAFFGKNNQGIDPGANQSICAVTGEEGNLVALESGEDTHVLPIVAQQVKLGKSLKDADYILTHKGREAEGISYLNQKAQMNIDPLGLNHHQYIFDERDLAYEESEWRNISSADTARVRRINNTNFLWEGKIKGARASYGFIFYGGNQQAQFNNARGYKEDKDFPKLARNDANEATYLGVLRMDVDGLGRIFQNGIPENLRSFSAYATLSAALDYFFSGWLNELRKQAPFKDHVNILYSGGDDLFVVGRWSETILFAEAVRKKFMEFTCNREDLSLSGGMVLMHEKFPIAIAADQAGEAEEKAKQFKYILDLDSQTVPDTKNAFTFFGETIGWHYEYGYVKNMAQQLFELYDSGKGMVTKGFLHKLIDLKLHKDYMLERQKTDPSIKNDYSYRWNAAYYIARYMDRFDTNKPEFNKIRRALAQIRNDLFTGVDDRYFDLIALAARWAEFHIKENAKFNF